MQTLHERRRRINTDYGYEGIQPEIIHQPQRRLWYISYRGAPRAQPPEYKATYQRTSAHAETQRYAIHNQRNRSQEGTDENSQPHKHYVGLRSRHIKHTDLIAHLAEHLLAPYQHQRVATVYHRLRRHLLQFLLALQLLYHYAAHRRMVAQLRHRMPVDLARSHQHRNPLHRILQKFGIIHLRPEQPRILDQILSAAAHHHRITLPHHSLRRGYLHRPVRSAYPIDIQHLPHRTQILLDGMHRMPVHEIWLLHTERAERHRAKRVDIHRIRLPAGFVHRRLQARGLEFHLVKSAEHHGAYRAEYYHGAQRAEYVSHGIAYRQDVDHAFLQIIRHIRIADGISTHGKQG